jgi:hypothetical protein
MRGFSVLHKGRELGCKLRVRLDQHMRRAEFPKVRSLALFPDDSDHLKAVVAGKPGHQLAELAESGGKDEAFGARSPDDIEHGPSGDRIDDVTGGVFVAHCRLDRHAHGRRDNDVLRPGARACDAADKSHTFALEIAGVQALAATTSPTPSKPAAAPLMRGWPYSPLRKWRSEGLTEAMRTLTSTSPGPGWGTGSEP